MESCSKGGLKSPVWVGNTIFFHYLTDPLCSAPKMSIHGHRTGFLKTNNRQKAHIFSFYVLYDNGDIDGDERL